MNEYGLNIKILGSPQAIKAIEDWLDTAPAYDELVKAIADITSQTISEAGVLGKKKVTITVDNKSLLETARQALRNSEKALDNIKGA